MAENVRIGCSGWSYPDWAGVVYPPGLASGQRFSWYAEQFDTVELNTTFYRLPSATTVQRWAQTAPPGFLYAVKVGAFGTHRKKLNDPETWLPNHLDRAALLGQHLGPNLFQLPPRWRRNDERLTGLLRALPGGVRWAIEFRDPSWLCAPVFDLLSAFGVALCLHDLLADHPLVVTTDWTYVRFHGPRALRTPYRGHYGPHRLAAWADWLSHQVASGNDIYCYFNNDFDGAAVDDARWLRSAVAPDS